MSAVRVRFAPSPTGELHIGGARTALLNWLFAKSNGGAFILRLEDTDLVRSQESYTEGILNSLSWLGLKWDEGPDKGGIYGPYRQSERLPVYQKYINQLLESGLAYYCFCPAEKLEKEKAAAHKEKRDYHYPGFCKDLSPDEINSYMSRGLKPVIRIKAPETGLTCVNDVIRGKVQFDNSLMDDFIIAKADGWPTYNLAVVIDDHTMKISHVIRAEEHLSNTPKQIILYKALGFELPVFAHVSMILAPDRKKLSKRHGATPIRELKENGYLPEALISYLGQLGGSASDEAVLAIDEMMQNFSLDKISRSSAMYDIEKLSWVNGHYLNSLSAERILDDLKDDTQVKDWIKLRGSDYLSQVFTLIKSRAKTLLDLVSMADYFYHDTFEYDGKGVQKHFTSGNTAEYLEQLQQALKTLPSFSAEAIEMQLRLLAERNGIKAAQIIHPARLALTGRTATPGLFEIMELLGKEVCLKRINRAIEFIKKLEA